MTAAQKYRAKLKALGICQHCCNKPRRSKRVLCIKCAEIQAQHDKTLREKRKENGVCVKCNRKPLAEMAVCSNHAKAPQIHTNTKYWRAMKLQGGE